MDSVVVVHRLVAPRHVESSQMRDWTRAPCTSRQILCATREILMGWFWRWIQVARVWSNLIQYTAAAPKWLLLLALGNFSSNLSSLLWHLYCNLQKYWSPRDEGEKTVFHCRQFEKHWSAPHDSCSQRKLLRVTRGASIISEVLRKLLREATGDPVSQVSSEWTGRHRTPYYILFLLSGPPRPPGGQQGRGWRDAGHLAGAPALCTHIEAPRPGAPCPHTRGQTYFSVCSRFISLDVWESVSGL